MFDSEPTKSRSYVWVAASCVVLIAAIGGLLAVSMYGLQTLTLARHTLQMEAEWTRYQKDAVLQLHRYALSGDEEEWDGYQESMEVIQAIRPALVASVEEPGDGDRLREILAAHPATAEMADYWADFVERSGTVAEVLLTSEIRLSRDELLRPVEGLADELRAAVLDAGPGSERASQLVREIQDVDAAVDALSTPFWNGVLAWTADREDFMVRSLVLTSLLLLAGGIFVVGLAAWRARRSEHALLESEERFRQVTENIREVFWLTDAEKRRMLYVSPTYEDLWGRGVDSLYADPGSWLEAVHPSDRERVRRAVDGQISGTYDVEFRILTPDGETRWIRDRAFPVRDRAGKAVRLAGIAENVTQRRELEQEIVRSQKLKSVGRLAGGVGHGFNNLLTVIQGHLQLILLDHGEGQLVPDLEEALEATRKAGDLTRHLLSFSGQQILVPKTVELSHFLSESLEMVRSVLPETVQLVDSLDEVKVRVDPTHLRDILLTLTSYAAEMAPERGVIAVQTRAERHHHAFSVEGGELAGGDWGVLEVQDNGRGIDPRVRDQLFEPFGLQEGVAASEGPRLAMASVFGVLDQSGGGIRVDSLPGDGTTFTVYFPSAPPSVGATSPEIAPEAVSGVEAVETAE